MQKESPVFSRTVTLAFGGFALAVIGFAVLYALFGHFLILAIYHRAVASHRVDILVLKCLVALSLLGAIAFLCVTFARCRTAVTVLLANLIVLELLLHTVNFFHPLFRASGLEDTYENQWLEGNDWLNGLTRLYTYKPKSGAATYGHPFRVNRWGFRGRDFAARDVVGWDTYRIMVLGDSIACGEGVAEEDRFTEVLEQALRAKYPGIKLEVINLSVQGFETLQEYKIMKRMWPIVRPNLTIVGLSDTDPNLHYKYHRVLFKLPVSGRMRVVLNKLLSFRILDTIYDPILRRVAHIPTAEDELDQAYNPQSRDWSIFEESVRRINQLASEETDKRPLVIALSDEEDMKKRNRYWPVRKTFEKSGFIWVDWEDQGPFEPVSRFEGHPNERTHQRYANALLARISELRIIPKWQESACSEKHSLSRERAHASANDGAILPFTQSFE